MPRVFKLVSVIVHTVVIAGVAIAQVFTVGPLPVPRQADALEYQLVKIADIVLPAPPRRPAAPAVSANAAPIVAPTGIAPEPEHQPTVTSQADAGLVSGVETAGAGLLGPGVVPGQGAPPPPPPKPVAPIPLHSGIEPPHKIVDAAPEYPQLARLARQAGVVILEAVIDVRGNVDTVRVLRGYPLLDEAAVRAVKQWRFTPALLNGQPVPVVMTVTVNFNLQ